MAVLSYRRTDAPGLQTKLQMNPTLIVSWWCTIFSFVVILIRIFGRWVRTERLFREDKVMLWSVVPLFIRMGFVHPVLVWGTNNTDIIALSQLSDLDVYHRSIASRLVLGSRIFYAIYIWVAKVTVLEFVQKIIGQSWTRFYERGARTIYVFLGCTLAGVIISTLTECRPFTHYWQVVPDPGPSCRTASAQLLVMGVCDIVTDVVLMAFPIPLVIMSKMPTKKKISLVLLFLLSCILIAITAYRMPSVVKRGYSQQFRSLLASLEILAATCVSNVIVIGSFLRDKGVKKVKFRGSISGDEYDGGSILTRPATRTTKPSVAQRHWGSDEDLVRELGLTVSHELRHDQVGSPAARLAPIAEPGDEPYRDVPSPKPTIAPQGRGLLDPAWTFRKGSRQMPQERRGSNASTDSSGSEDFKLQTLEPYKDEPQSPGAVPETPYKKMSFFDVGGLFEGPKAEESSQSSGQRSQVVITGPTSRSGQNFISDVGGLLGAPRSSSRVDEATQSTGYQSALLSPERTTRARSRSPFERLRRSMDSSRNRSTGAIPPDIDDADDLKISDAGGLLK